MPDAIKSSGGQAPPRIQPPSVTDAQLFGGSLSRNEWTLRGTRGLPSATSAGMMLPTAKGPAARLFAFGFDAWQLTAYLERLALSANADVDGATGRRGRQRRHPNT